MSDTTKYDFPDDLYVERSEVSGMINVLYKENLRQGDVIGLYKKVGVFVAGSIVLQPIIEEENENKT